MKEVITMNYLTDIAEFCRRAMDVEGGVTVSRGKFVVDGASQLGVISINPVEPVTVTWEDSEANLAFTQFVSALKSGT